MSKGQTKKTREAAGNRRKLTRAEKKQIAEAIRKAKGDGKAHTAQQTIPYLAMYPDGICKVTERDIQSASCSRTSIISLHRLTIRPPF